MDDNSYRDWVMLLDSQCGIADRSQARQAGFSIRQIEHRLSSGKWRAVYPGVYATFTGPLTREARLWAALRRAGEGAMLSHETAAELQGLIDKPTSKIHVTVPSRRRPAQRTRMREVVIHRSDVSRPQLPFTWKLPRTRVEDTVLDLAGAAPTFDDAYGWISRALSRQCATAGMLRSALSYRSRIRWRDQLSEALADADEGIHFVLERRYVRDVERAHGLPKAQRQARRQIDGKIHYKDNWYAEYRVCVELDGPSYHQNDQVWQDKRRDNLNLAVDGVQTHRFGPADVTELACRSAVLVAATLRRCGWEGKPRPCRRPGCTVGRQDLGSPTSLAWGH